MAEYKFAHKQPHESKRDRKLLLKKKEIKNIQRALNQKGVTVVPIDLYLKNQKIKLTIALARGKKKFEKRELIKKKDLDRNLRRGLKNI